MEQGRIFRLLGHPQANKKTFRSVPIVCTICVRTGSLQCAREKGVLMAARCLGEFMGTLVLILLGDGVVANVLLKRSKAEGAGWMVITSGWAFAVMAGVFFAGVFGGPGAPHKSSVTMGVWGGSWDFFKKFASPLAPLLYEFFSAP